MNLCTSVLHYYAVRFTHPRIVVQSWNTTMEMPRMTQETLRLTDTVASTYNWETEIDWENLSPCVMPLSKKRDSTKNNATSQHIPALHPRMIPPWREATICKPCYVGQCCQGVVNDWSVFVSNQDISKQKQIEHTMTVYRQCIHTMHNTRS